jgi:hypothetical protein
MIGTRTSSTGIRPMAIVGLLTVVAVSVAVGAVTAGNLTSGRPAAGGHSGVTLPALAVSSPTPTAASTAAPSTRPSSAPTPAPSAHPTGADGLGRDAIPLTVDLTNETNDKVYIDIADNSGLLVDAVSGTPRDGASVEPYTLRVENIDARTLRLTWSDYAIPNALALYIDETASRFMLVQPEPKGDVDAMVHDRVLILTFSEPISADDIQPILQDGLDT